MINNKLIAITCCIMFVSANASAVVLKDINFESDTVGAQPSVSTTDSSKINKIKLGNPTVKNDGDNYLHFNQITGYDQIEVANFSYSSSLSFSFDLFLTDTSNNYATLFFDTPKVQRYDIYGTGTIKAFNAHPSGASSSSTHTVNYTLTQWHNYLFNIDFTNNNVDVYIDNILAFSDTIYINPANISNGIRFSTSAAGNQFGIDNLKLTNNVVNVSEPPSLLLMALSLFGAGFYRKARSK